MIDWTTTGKIDLNTYRPKVIIKCDSCGKTSTYTIRTKSKIKNNQIPWLCYKCATNKKEIKQKHSEQQQKIWQKKDYQEKRKQFTTKLWKNEEYKKRISESEKKFWNNEEIKTKLSSYYKKLYENPNMREESRKRSLELWKNPTYRENVARGTCEKYTGPSSSLNDAFEIILKDCNIKYRREVPIGPYIFDFLIEGSKSILVEINGEYWHNLPVSIERDNRKASYAKSLASIYDFKVIWEHEFFSRGRIRDKVKEWLGLKEGAKLLDFDFKDVVIKEVSNRDARIFFSLYHYTSSLGRGGKIFGGYLNDELIACIVYAYPTRKEVALKQGLSIKEVREISRLAISDNRHKKNFPSWFIAKTLKFIDVPMIIAFADSTFNHLGTSYKASNFRLDGIVEPSYWYLTNDGWFMHKKTLYERAIAMRMNEKEYAEKHGYRKIFGGEKYRYVRLIRRK